MINFKYRLIFYKSVNKKLFVVLMTVCMSVPIIYAQTDDMSLSEQINKLEKEMENKDMLILEQVKVINELYLQVTMQYEPFSLEKFPDTDGFNPLWLENERDKIHQTCIDAESDGYHNLKYCKHIS